MGASADTTTLGGAIFQLVLEVDSEKDLDRRRRVFEGADPDDGVDGGLGGVFTLLLLGGGGFGGVIVGLFTVLLAGVDFVLDFRNDPEDTFTADSALFSVFFTGTEFWGFVVWVCEISQVVSLVIRFQ